MTTIYTKRIYEAATPSDGIRILVDKLWPRGISKEKAQLTYWAKDIAPSNELRKQFHQALCNEKEFKHLYFAELHKNQDALNDLIKYIRKNNVVTFLFSRKGIEFNNATVLKEYMQIENKY